MVEDALGSKMEWNGLIVNVSAVANIMVVLVVDFYRSGISFLLNTSSLSSDLPSVKTISLLPRSPSF